MDVTEELVTRVRALRGEGKTLTEIAETIGIAVSTAGKLCSDGSKRHTAAERAKIVGEYQAGTSSAELAAQHGVAQWTLQRWIREAGASRRSGPASKSSLNEEITRLWKQGLSVAEIARRCSAAQETVRRVVLYVPDGGPGMKISQDAATAVERYRAGETIEEIARSQGRSVNTVSRWLKNAEVPILSSLARMSPAQRQAAAQAGADAMKAKKQMLYRTCDLDGCEEHFLLRSKNDRRMYCTEAHAGLARRDATKRTVYACKRCGTEFEGWTNQARSYCSTACRGRGNPDGFRVVSEGRQFDSSWEVLFWTVANLLGVRVERNDRENLAKWAPQKDGYAPDFVVFAAGLPTSGLPVEVKGYERGDDPAKWEAWRAEYEHLAVVDFSLLHRLRVATSRAEFVGILQEALSRA